MYINGDEILAAHPELQAELAANHKLKDDPQYANNTSKNTARFVVPTAYSQL